MATACSGDHATIPGMTTANTPYVKRDLAHVWHPCTQMKDHEELPLIPIRRARGVWLEDFEHVILAGFTHEPVIELSEALVKILPAGLTRCFYADNGSSAVEVAVKMSFHYWCNVGRTAKR